MPAFNDIANLIVFFLGNMFLMICLLIKRGYTMSDKFFLDIVGATSKNLKISKFLKVTPHDLL